VGFWHKNHSTGPKAVRDMGHKLVVGASGRHLDDRFACLEGWWGLVGNQVVQFPRAWD